MFGPARWHRFSPASAGRLTKPVEYVPEWVAMGVALCLGIGTMWANRSGIQPETLREIALAWVLTLPVAMALASNTAPT